MEYELIFSPRSEQDTNEALSYYDQINPELGDRFLTELFDTYQKLSIAPQYYSYINTIRKSNMRDVKLPSFPYVVIYEIIENSVYIYAVMNTYRKPLFT